MLKTRQVFNIGLVIMAIFGSLVFGASVFAAAGINPQFNYQGRLTNSSGANVSDGAYNFVFKLYAASSGGSAIWTETWNTTTRFSSTVTGTPPISGGTSVTYTDDATESYLAVGDALYNTTANDEVIIEAFNTTSNVITISPTSKAWSSSDAITTRIYVRSGLFSSRLGSITSLSSINLNQTPLYLGVAVGADSEMTPRKRITSVLQAFQANKLDGYLTSTSTSAASEYGSTLTVSDTGIVTAGTDATYGLNISATRTGATGGTIDTYGIYSAVTGDTGGTSTAVAGYFSATGADNNYGLIVANGNVGIGTTAPAALLHISGAPGTRGQLSLTDTTGGNTLISFYQTSSYKGYIYYDSNVNDFHFQNYNAGSYGDIVLNMDGGNVGIGTSSPSHKLQITDTDTTASRAGFYVAQSGAISGTGYGGYFTKTGASTTNIGLYASATGATNNYAAIFENGNVGIGTTSPTAGKLVIAQTDAANLQALTIDTEESTGAQNVFSVISDSGSDENTILNLTAAGDLKIDGSLTTGGASTIYADGSITKSSGSAMNVNLGGAAGDDFIVDTNTLVVESDNDRVGIGTTTPNTALDLNGALSARGMSAPSVSPSGQGRLYYDSTANKFKISENGGGYINLIDGASTQWTTFHVYRTGNQAIPDSTITKVQFNAERFDVSNVFDSTTNYRFTVPTGGDGMYLFGANIDLGSITTNAIYKATLYKNGALHKYLWDDTSGTAYNYIHSGSTLLSLAAGDYIEIYVYSNSTGIIIVGGEDYSAFWGMRVNYGSSKWTSGAGDDIYRGLGNVGIGASSPSHKLQITDTDTTASRAGFYVAQSGAISGTGYGGYFTKTGASTTNIGLYASATGATNNYAAIFENGNVGIGTTAPSFKLHVVGGSIATDNLMRTESTVPGAGTFYLSNDGTDALIVHNRAGGDIRILTRNTGGGSDTEKVRIDSDGSVGIGTTAPGWKLDVAGSASINNNLLTQTDGGLYYGRVGVRENQFALTNHGVTWIARDSAREWFSVAMSSDGKYQTATVTTAGQIYISSDYGATWAARDSVRNWYGVAMSSDGKYQTAVVNNGQLYTSSDYGATWTARDSVRYWDGVAMSSDAKYQTAGVYGGQLYTSSDYGATWTARDSVRNWQEVAMSSDAKYQTAGVYGGQLYTSSDYGATWMARDSSRNWGFIAMSSDGKYQTATIVVGQIYTSSDYGATWTARDSSRTWRGISMSSDGKYQTATVNGGQIYTSSDYGATWTARDSSRGWRDIAMSSDGKYQTALATSGQIYTSYADSYVYGGNVGIGTTSPDAKLKVYNTGVGPASGLIYAHDLSSGVNTNPIFVITNGGSGNSVIVQNQAGTRHFTIKSDGSVGIGTTNPVYQLELTTDSAAKPSTNTWSIASDARIKTDITDFKEGLATVLAINPRVYKYNGAGGLGYDDKNTHIGIIAQELELVAPYMIETRKGIINGSAVDDFKSYQGHALSFVLINAIKDLDAKLNSLAAASANLTDNSQLTTNNEEQYWLINSSGRLASTVDLDLGGKSIYNIGGIFSQSGKWKLDENGYLEVEKVAAKKVKTDKFEMTDMLTGQIYCVSIANSEWLKVAGECAVPAEQNSQLPITNFQGEIQEDAASQEETVNRQQTADTQTEEPTQNPSDIPAGEQPAQEEINNSQPTANDLETELPSDGIDLEATPPSEPTAEPEP